MVELSIKGEKEAVDQGQIKPRSFSWKPKSQIKAEFFLTGSVPTVCLMPEQWGHFPWDSVRGSSRHRKSGFKTISILQIPDSVPPSSFSQNSFHEVLFCSFVFPYVPRCPNQIWTFSGDNVVIGPNNLASLGNTRQTGSVCSSGVIQQQPLRSGLRDSP